MKNGEFVKFTITGEVNKDVNEQVRLILKCFYGVDITPEQMLEFWDKTYEYVTTQYTNPYFQGQAAAFIVTILLPPVVKIIQSGKFALLITKFRNINVQQIIKDLAKVSSKLLDKALIVELKNAGIKFTELDLKWIFKNKNGKIIFLEEGNSKAGYQHILNHKNEFITKGIAEENISDFIMEALNENKIVGYQGVGTGRPIYEITYKGIKQRVAITTSSNGFVVGANPVSF